MFVNDVCIFEASQINVSKFHVDYFAYKGSLEVPFQNFLYIVAKSSMKFNSWLFLMAVLLHKLMFLSSM